jgi:hypothetical protein
VEPLVCINRGGEKRKRKRKMEKELTNYFASQGWKARDTRAGVYGYYHPSYPFVHISFHEICENKDGVLVAISNSYWKSGGGADVPIPLKIVRIREGAKLEGLIDYLLPFAMIEDFGN